jgi:DNA-binding transcriptional LysR family regulator
MKVNTDWDKFKLFYYVAKAGSFTAAATVLNITQPAISRSIQLLEHQLKIKLFERLPRGLVLTKQGESLLQATERAFEAFSRAEILMLEETDEPQGSLLQQQWLLQLYGLCLISVIFCASILNLS